ncbi:hypothetical protein HG66A1_64510 [Gimesia chilikensis]|uniref:Uncharacterized protein n=2 Tax=Gimesia chilikensis TaxID=2605989 RepID=A0A517PZ03_9PLAN|nr:hypothetical protein HG66A1_64510 [Gimesia chilikensis]
MSCRTSLGNFCLLTAFAFSLSCGARLFAQSEPTAPVVIELNDEYFDPETGILKVHVTLQNQQNIPIYLVANQWTFLKGAPGSNTHHLTVQRQKDLLIFDLSHLPVTERFWNAIHEVGLILMVLQSNHQDQAAQKPSFCAGISTSAPAELGIIRCRHSQRA